VRLGWLAPAWAGKLLKNHSPVGVLIHGQHRRQSAASSQSFCASPPLGDSADVSRPGPDYLFSRSTWPFAQAHHFQAGVPGQGRIWRGDLLPLECFGAWRNKRHATETEPSPLVLTRRCDQGGLKLALAASLVRCAPGPPARGASVLWHDLEPGQGGSLVVNGRESGCRSGPLRASSCAPFLASCLWAPR